MPWIAYPPLAFRDRVFGNVAPDSLDIIVVTGDAYVDHPAWPAARVTRLAQALGYRVGVIAQPDWRGLDDFMRFGRPHLTFCVTAGSMDSMVAGFTAEGMPRSEDRLSPGGKPGLRPKRATAVYCQRLREAFPGVPVIIGGVEAALRRFAHVDFWENRVRDPILFDAPATVLVTGTAESALPNVLAALAAGRSPVGLPQTGAIVPKGRTAEMAATATATATPGHSTRRADDDGAGDVNTVYWLPSVADVRADPRALMQAVVELDRRAGAGRSPIAQAHAKGEMLTMPAAADAATREIEWLRRLRFNRRVHPLYGEGVPGLEPVQFSIVSHLGCAGACSFCAIALQQGRMIRSRPIADLVAEAESFVRHPDFHGTIPDLGGPSVNMYGWHCRIGGCAARLCLHPRRCPNLMGDLSPLAEALAAVAGVGGVRFVFLGSGLRFDLLRPGDEPAFRQIVRRHVSGQLKVAPEHVDPAVLALMRKTPIEAPFAEFVERFDDACRACQSRLFLVPYFLTAFPGSVGRDGAIRSMADRLRLARNQTQIFTPTPGSVATAMYFSRLDLEGQPLEVPQGRAERRAGKEQVQRPGKPPESDRPRPQSTTARHGRTGERSGGSSNETRPRGAGKGMPPASHNTKPTHPPKGKRRK